MSTSYNIRDDGSEQIEQFVAGCRVTLVFKAEDNPNLTKDITSLILGAYNDRREQKRKATP